LPPRPGPRSPLGRVRAECERIIANVRSQAGGIVSDAERHARDLLAVAQEEKAAIRRNLERVAAKRRRPGSRLDSAPERGR